MYFGYLFVLFMYLVYGFIYFIIYGYGRLRLVLFFMRYFIDVKLLKKKEKKNMKKNCNNVLLFEIGFGGYIFEILFGVFLVLGFYDF